MIHRRRGVILPVVLLVLVLLGLLGAMFSLRVHSDSAATQAMANRLQTRLAAEAGVERVKLLLRTSKFDVNRWFHNPEELHRVIVWSEGGDPTVWGKTDELDEGVHAYRFSIVADDSTDDENFIRLGITDESSKLNLNAATAGQLLKLVTAAVDGDQEIDPQTIVDAIMDWRDADSEPSGEDPDTEGEYYRSLVKPYKVRNGKFDTVEELLLVKGVTGAILYGEDFDRNGLLTPNEDDGENHFPPDNQDGRLNRGLYPYLTVLSFENNVSNDQRPRVSLAGSSDSIRNLLKDDFPDDPDVVEFLATTGRSQVTRQTSTRHGGGRNSTTPARLPGGRTPRFNLPRTGADQAAGNPLQPPKGGEELLPPELPTTRPPRKPEDQKRGPLEKQQEGGTGSVPPQRNPRRGGSARGNTDGARFFPQDEVVKEETKEPTNPSGEGPPIEEPAPGVDEGKSPDEQGEKPGERPETGDGTKPPEPIRSPAELMLLQTGADGKAIENPLRLEHLAVLMDRLTVESADRQQLPGLININTAPPAVLECLEDLSGGQMEALLAKRPSLDAATKSTTAWLVTEEVVDLETYAKIAPKITARGQQFTIESLGYADHHGAITRLQVVVDMIGPLCQTIYYRDASYLGGRFPIREKDKERIGVR
jgi:type II secretory pathway component PulK